MNDAYIIDINNYNFKNYKKRTFLEFKNKDTCNCNCNYNGKDEYIYTENSIYNKRKLENKNNLKIKKIKN